MKRRELFRVLSKLGLSLSLAPFIESTGCTSELYDVEVKVKAARDGSVLEITRSQLNGVEIDRNSFRINGVNHENMYVFSVNDMWGDWVYEVNGSRINQDVASFHVGSGDNITWKGNFRS